jgi:hypothetical protein
LVRAFSVISLLLVAVPARAADPAGPPAPGAPPPLATAQDVPGEPPASAPGGDGANAHDEEFAPEVPPPSVALGPTPRGGAMLALDLGWLRSGVRADLGLGATLSIFLSMDTLLLYDGFHGPSGVHIGLRTTPLQGPFRATAEISIGEVFAPRSVSSANTTTLRLGGAAGLVTGWATVYARAALRGSAGSFESDAGWTRDEELGVGIERALSRRLVVGAEAYLWYRPGLATLGEWTIRIAYAR